MPSLRLALTAFTFLFLFTATTTGRAHAESAPLEEDGGIASDDGGTLPAPDGGVTTTSDAAPAQFDAAPVCPHADPSDCGSESDCSVAVGARRNGAASTVFGLALVGGAFAIGRRGRRRVAR